MRTILLLLTPIATAAAAALPAPAPAETSPAGGASPAARTAAGRAHRPARLAPRRHHQRRRHRAAHHRWLRGEASNYGIGDGLLGGSLACGGRLDTRRAVVAHRTLKCHTRLLVCRGKRCIRAIVADRGPFVGGRVLDLGPRVARAIGMDRVGVGSVRYRLLR